MSRRLDIGIASYGNPAGLQRLLESLMKTCTTDWRAVIVVNSHPDQEQNDAVNRILKGWEDIDSNEDGERQRIKLIRPKGNIGYVGAVNRIMQECESEYIAYCDHDVVHHSNGWDELMALTLDRYHELGIVFPNGGPYPIPRAMYVEILWGVGCNWMMSRRVAAEVGGFDPEIGHHEEVDYQIRLRLAGYKIAALPQIQVQHMAVASSDPASQDRISKGVINWVNKWVRYFGGQNMSYFASNVLRHEDWPTSALYLEEYFKQALPNLNLNPEVVVVNGQEFDLIKVPRLKGFYRSRII